MLPSPRPLLLAMAIPPLRPPSLRDSKDVNQYKLTSRIWMPKLGFSQIFISHARLGYIVDLACPVLGTLVRMIAPLLLSPQRSCS